MWIDRKNPCGLTGRIHVDWPEESMWIDRYDIRINISAVPSHITYLIFFWPCILV
jgi:hypothetical protein